MSEDLGIADNVDFCVNASAAEVRELLGGAVGGLHSMVYEHFGISIVEYMAAGKLKAHTTILAPDVGSIQHETCTDWTQECL